jgi:hypothetical protein
MTGRDRAGSGRLRKVGNNWEPAAAATRTQQPGGRPDKRVPSKVTGFGAVERWLSVSLSA